MNKNKLINALRKERAWSLSTSPTLARLCGDAADELSRSSALEETLLGWQERAAPLLRRLSNTLFAKRHKYTEVAIKRSPAEIEAEALLDEADL